MRSLIYASPNRLKLGISPCWRTKSLLMKLPLVKLSISHKFKETFGFSLDLTFEHSLLCLVCSLLKKFLKFAENGALRSFSVNGALSLGVALSLDLCFAITRLKQSSLATGKST